MGLKAGVWFLAEEGIFVFIAMFKICMAST
jgi:hypothetical protein